MGKIKKYFIFISFNFILSVIFVLGAKAYVAGGMAVLPADFPVVGSSYSIFPASVRLISNDVANEFASRSDLPVIEVNEAEKMIKDSGFSKSYRKLITDYKDTYTIDYVACQQLASVLGVDRLLFISGGFDTQNPEMKHSWLSKFSFPDTNNITPIYNMNLHMLLLDVTTKRVLWEKGYNEKFNANDFAIPSYYFGENSSSLAKIKSYSKKLAASVADSVTIADSTLTDLRVNGEIADPQLKPISYFTPRDGYMAKDWPFKNIIEMKKQQYKSWAINHSN